MTLISNGVLFTFLAFAVCAAVVIFAFVFFMIRRTKWQEGIGPTRDPRPKPLDELVKKVAEIGDQHKEAVKACWDLAKRFSAILSASMRAFASNPLLSLQAVLDIAMKDPKGLGATYFSKRTELDQIFGHNFIRKKSGANTAQQTMLRERIENILRYDIRTIVAALETPLYEGDATTTILSSFLPQARTATLKSKDATAELLSLDLPEVTAAHPKAAFLFATLLANETRIAEAVFELSKGYRRSVEVRSGNKTREKQESLSLEAACELATLYVLKTRIKILEDFASYLKKEQYLDYDLPPQVLCNKINPNRSLTPWRIPRIGEDRWSPKVVDLAAAAQYSDMIHHLLRCRNPQLNADLAPENDEQKQRRNKPVVYDAYLLDGQRHSATGWKIYLLKGWVVLWPDIAQAMIRFSHIQRAPRSESVVQHDGHMLRLDRKAYVIAYRKNVERRDFIQFMILDGKNRGDTYEGHYQRYLGSHSCFEAFDVGDRDYGVVSTPVLLEANRLKTKELRRIAACDGPDGIRQEITRLEQQSAYKIIETRDHLIVKTVRVRENGREEDAPLTHEERDVLRTLVKHPQSGIEHEIADL